MIIAFISIKNFRKLKSVKIDFSKDKTLFVGANNSGKTSAMDALRKFLVKGDGNNFVYNDITVTNRHDIKLIGEKWVADEAEKPKDLSDWVNIVPIMDVWLDVEHDEFHYVANIIPTLDWTGGHLGVHLCFLPKNIERLFTDYREAYFQSRKTESSPKNKDKVKLFPQNLCEFIERYLNQYFEVRAFILDPSLENEEQPIDFGYECEEKNPFSGLVQIDMIYAQRGLADADSSNETISLSEQLRAYYDKHLDIEKQTTPEDLKTLSALQAANKTFDSTLASKFKESFTELQKLGFPGITDPKITIETKLSEKNAFEHKSAVQYALTDDDLALRLPEKYNGLGYQNLISIAFKLMSFRDGRIHKGKAIAEENADSIVPLHLVLFEEPEAHLHVQVQQVLIKKAYEILTDNEVLRTNKFNTQLVVSTHSSHIAKEVAFDNIRYFKRSSTGEQNPISASKVVNLSDTFGGDKITEKFVQRYLRVTHCDLFFADAVIFVEGTSETVLVPYFINNDFPELDSRYITVLPVGGSHSHRFKPLISKLGIIALIITDLDPVIKTVKPDKNGINRTTYSHVFPKRSSGQVSGNSSIEEWYGVERTLDELLDLPCCKKEFADNTLRLAYQNSIAIMLNDNPCEALSATFEISLVYANYPSIIELYEEDKKLESCNKKFKKGDFIVKIATAFEKTSIDEVCNEIYETVRDKANDKVSFALDLIYWLERIEVPLYIKEGLEWLQSKLHRVTDEERTGGDNNND